MSINSSTNLANPDTLPADITSPRAKLVYLYVDVVGNCAVDDLQGCLDMRKIELLSVLDSLVSNGHIDYTDGTYAPAS